MNTLTIDLTGDEDLIDEDVDIGIGDSTGVSASLGGEIFLGGKKCQESNISDSDNTGDGSKIVSRAIRACGGIGINLISWEDGAYATDEARKIVR
ncbi:hypothetical protein Tco_0727926 [Tanacetum coccineum]|uniref:Uncharacterized protein n=1 Tax=Tanacetum coccineum TaxID=301880 RepID=A0ABQ4YKA7_9ASTR